MDRHSSVGGLLLFDFFLQPGALVLELFSYFEQLSLVSFPGLLQGIDFAAVLASLHTQLLLFSIFLLLKLSLLTVQRLDFLLELLEVLSGLLRRSLEFLEPTLVVGEHFQEFLLFANLDFGLLLIEVNLLLELEFLVFDLRGQRALNLIGRLLFLLQLLGHQHSLLINFSLELFKLGLKHLVLFHYLVLFSVLRLLVRKLTLDGGDVLLETCEQAFSL